MDAARLRPDAPGPDPAPFDQEPTFACSPPPGTARVDVVLAAARGSVPAWALRRLPEGYRPVPVPLDADAPDGLSGAWAAGLARATAPVVVLYDGRSGVDPRQVDRLAEPVVRGSADLVLGTRHRGVGLTGLIRWPLHRRLADALAAERLSRALDAAGSPTRLLDCGRVLAGRRQLLAGVRGSGPEELLAACAEGGWRLAQLPVRCGPGPLER